MEALFSLAKELASSRTWSAGVELARNADFQEQRCVDTEERIFRLIQGPRDRVITVSLSEPNELWQCDCGEDDDPCRHVVATIIAVRQGLQGRALVRPTRAAPGHVIYSFTRQGRRLLFGRFFAWENERTPVNGSLYRALQSLPKGSPGVATSKEEMQLDHILVSKKEGVLDPKTMRLLVSALAESRSIELDGEPIGARREPIVPAVVIMDEAGGFRLRRELDPLATEVFENGVAVRAGVLCGVEDSSLSADELAMFQGEGTLFPTSRAADLAGRVVPILEGKVRVEIRSRELPRARRIAPRIVIETMSDERGEQLTVVPHLLYGEPPLAEIHGERIRYLSKREVPVRDPVEEARLIRDVQSRLHLKFNEAKVFSGEGAILFSSQLKGWETRGEGRSVFTPATGLTPRASADGADLSLFFTTEEGKRAELESVLSAWRSGGSFVPLADGGWGALPKAWLATHREALERLLAAQRGREQLAPHLLSEVSELCDAIGVSPPEYFKRLRDGLDRIASIPDAELPPELTATLRPYQRQGVNWLSFLREYGLNALLADDMGLGKTLQAICIMRGRTLVVAPTSVVHSWRDQIQRFRPNMRVSLYHGPNRELCSEAAVTITTYAVMRLDIEKLIDAGWEMVVLDEAQTIRNPDSQVARAAYRLRAPFKVNLSGTPVENSLEDLWSQFYFLNPGLLGSRRDFEEGFSRAVRSGDANAATRLRSRVTPFILRRLKRDVAKELPPKTEVVLACELSADERTLYEAVLGASRTELLQRLEQGESVFSVLEILLRLRQACCHPALLPGHNAPSSSKVDMLVESLAASIVQEHRALVFSQWTSLLDLVEPHLLERGISFSRVDGSTLNRAELVEQFQRPDGPNVMLLSLKAGGLGLTLTAADHVYILDPWWNPAVEDQAADRAYRIGQEDPVIVHRLVAQDSIEERILELQQRKRELLAAALGESGEVALSREDVLQLLA